MTAQEKDRIECAIRHIQTAVDVDPWAKEIAVDAMKTQLSAEGTTSDLISRQAAIDAAIKADMENNSNVLSEKRARVIDRHISAVPSAQPENNKYEYHYDHTDCIWYRPEARNRCPVTCAQYRDGWNDAMNYIFRDGKGYRPYRRDEQYGQ